MTNASLLDELGKSPVNPFPRNVRPSRGVKGGRGSQVNSSLIHALPLLALGSKNFCICFESD